MEEGTHVWLRTPKSEWGWVPAKIIKKVVFTASKENDEAKSHDAEPSNTNDEVHEDGTIIELTLIDDFASLGSIEGEYFKNTITSTSGYGRQISGMLESASTKAEPFTTTLRIDASQPEHPDVKLRNMPASSSTSALFGVGKRTNGHDSKGAAVGEPSTLIHDSITGGVDDLIGLTHLHEPAILHALRLRYTADIIYTSTGPILLAINPFKTMEGVYGGGLMDLYRRQGEEKLIGRGGGSGGSSNPTSPTNAPEKSPTNGRTKFNNNTIVSLSSPSVPLTDTGKPIPSLYLHRPNGKLPPHVYQTADDAYRAMMRGIDMDKFLKRSTRKSLAGSSRHIKKESEFEMPTNQSILVSGESGAGKTVTTKIVLNYFAMLSRKLQEKENIANQQINGNGGASIEQQVLQSNPIVEAFGNARTMRNDNSSRFGKYINIAFTSEGKLLRASIDTYLLEKVRLIHQCRGERNFHIFYQFLASASRTEREELCLNDMTPEDFLLTNQSETYDRRDGVSDVDMHNEMVEAMQIMNFGEDTVQHLMRLIVAILFAGNMTFAADSHSSSYSESCSLEENEASLAVAKLLGVSFDKLAASLTTKVLFARGDIIHKGLDRSAAEKANEALIKSMYGAAFDFITEKINLSINAGSSDENGGASKSTGRNVLRKSLSGVDAGAGGASIVPPGGASIGVLDIFGFETFDVNNFEQLCINYTNETLQQQFNKFVFKLEQQEYEREGILWKFIPFPDNQDVLDLIDKPRTGILQLLDEQCMVNWGSDEKFSLNLYSNCEKHSRFSAGSAQKVRKQFSVEHYAGYVEYTIENWLEKNKDQLPAASVELLESSEFELIGQIKKYVRSEGSKITTKSLGKQFSDSLKILRARIDATVPHYVRCLKPNDELAPDNFDPKQIVEQLRYCGVLEAVRVSRAGYPTRYPHDVFMSRYYMLCPNRSSDSGNLSPYHDESTGNLSEEQKQLKRLVSRVATDVWKLEHEVHQRQLNLERRHLVEDSPKVQQQPTDVNSAHALARPQTLDEFLKLDFPSRCAVAGLQLGQTKVFLRRDAFDFIEAIRNEKFGRNVTKISKTWRRYYVRRCYFYSLSCVIRIQCLIRKARARIKTGELMKAFKEYLRMKDASRKIARSYRNHYALNREGAELHRKKEAIIKIQGTMRGHLARRQVFFTIACIVKLQSILRMIRRRQTYERERVAIIMIQCFARMVIAKYRYEEAIRQRAATTIESVARMRFQFLRYKKQKMAATLIKVAYRQHLYQVRLLYGTFLKRYYMLGDPADFNKKKTKRDRKKKILLARHRNAIINEKRQELIRLVNKLSAETWQPGMFESFSKPKLRDAPQSSPTSVVKRVRPPPAPLPDFTPIPQSKEGYLERSLPSRYCLAGMQLCHGTVFLRPETFARLEDMRNTLVAGSSAKIQAAARRKIGVEDLKRKKAATIKIQSVLRMVFAKRQLVPMRKEFAAALIQSVWRMSATKRRVWNQYWSTQTTELSGYIVNDNWYMVEKMLHKNPLLVEEEDQGTGELPLHKIVERASPWTLLIDMVLTLYPKAVVHKDFQGSLPIHHAAKADNVTALGIIYESYKDGARDVDSLGRLPIHVAATHGSIEAIKYLTMKAPDGASTAVIPGSDYGGSLPLHLACKHYSSVGVITTLMRSSLQFSLAGATDENGELPLHLLLRGGAAVDVSAVKTVLTCHLNAISTRDRSGDIPLHIALKSCCKPEVIETLLAHFPGSSVVMDGEGRSPLFLALSNSAEDETSLSLINHAPQLVTFVDQSTGKLPIQVATENDLSLFIVYRLLKKDMPIDLNEKVQVRLIPHFFSWNHIMVDVGDRYYQVVSKILQQCTQPQVLALAHVEDADGNIALASATPICRHEVRVMLRLFNTLELVKQRPAFTNASSDTEIFYALRFEPPLEQSDLFCIDYESKKSEIVDYTEDWDDDLSQVSGSSGPEKKGKDSKDVNMSVSERLKLIRNEKGQQVIAKITPRADVVERELKIRKDFNLSRHYVPSVISVHHTVHHGAYQNASAEPAYCITMEGADATVEHLMLDLRRAGKGFPSNELKRIGMSLLHLHENGLVHTDFGPHNVGKFGPLFKMLGVGGCVPAGGTTDPKHGIYHPPEAVVVETVIIDGKERKTARVISITAEPSHDIWAFGNMVYEAIVGAPLSAYSHRGQRVKSSNLAKIARWDDQSLTKALRHIDEEDKLARDVISKLLHPNPSQRFQSIRDAIADPFFNTDSGDRKIKRKTPSEEA
eukprot:CCRYP_005870-RA/>CCRYP_005870-RA protein AED:0.20 eAED:0.20 QI:295/1/1/1/0.88/0.8/10/1786/2243